MYKWKTTITSAGRHGVTDKKQKADEPKGGYANFDPKAIDAYVVKDPEAMAVNLARALENLGQAASAWLAPRERGERSNVLADPMTDLIKTMSKVGEYWLSDPRRAFDAQTQLLSGYFGMWNRTMQRFAGDDDPAAAAQPRDKRFTDGDWENNPFFDFVRQT